MRGVLSCLLVVAGLSTGCTRGDAGEAAVPRARVAAERAWARTADSGSLTAAYLVLVNTGDVADTLKALRSEAATETTMHVSIDRGRTMQMVPVGALPIRPGDSLVLRPLGTHVMLTGLRQSLQDGDSIQLTLDFASGTSLAVPVVVRRP
jgi:copper(I)-binding protein